MRVLITGGFGYVGGRLGQFLASTSDSEILLGTRKLKKSPKWLSSATVVKTKWDSLDEMQLICRDVETVIHMAGMNAQDCAEDPVAALEFNGVATARLLQASVQQGVKRFIYFSTAHVYSNSLKGVISENTPTDSLHPYATSHRAGEDLVRAAHQRGEIEGIVIRLSNAYGAPVQKEANCWMLLVNDLCRQAVVSRVMTLRTSGIQRRDFISLYDVCRAIGHLLQLSREEIGNGIFNLGSGWSPMIWEMACLIQSRCEIKLGFKPEINRPEMQSDETINELEYRCNALGKTGFQLNSDRSEEIDRLLYFCKTAFSE